MTSARGFSLVELLVSLAVCAVFSAALAAVVPSARLAFNAAPAVLDLQQRGRTGVDVLAAAIRSADFGDLFPPVIPLAPLPDGDDTEFEALYVISPVASPARGELQRDQPGPRGPLTLAAAPGCPAIRDVCGFTAGAVAAIADGSGRFDVFTVASTNAVRREIMPANAFSAAYPAGSAVFEVQTHYFRLDDQSDGTRALVRETAGGATQPIVDNVSAMAIQLRRETSPTPLSAGDLDDGPFFEGGPEGSYDADLFVVNRVDVRLSVGVPPVLLRDPNAVRDRTLHATFALRNVNARTLP